jgi:hydroxymethylglutaryl-CoA reductase
MLVLMVQYIIDVGGSFARSSLKSNLSGIYVSIALPSLNVGTVGGGTSLATQKECLQLIDCYGKVSSLVQYEAGCCHSIFYLLHTYTG